MFILHAVQPIDILPASFSIFNRGFLVCCLGLTSDLAPEDGIDGSSVHQNTLICQFHRKFFTESSSIFQCRCFDFSAKSRCCFPLPPHFHILELLISLLNSFFSNRTSKLSRYI